MELDKPIALKEEYFEIFKNEVRFWIDRFGLKDWQINFSWEDCLDSRASIAFDTLARTALVSLSKEWREVSDEFICETNVRRSAFHEVCELLLGKLCVLAIARTSLESDIDEEIHKIVRTLENTVWEKEGR